MKMDQPHCSPFPEGDEAEDPGLAAAKQPGRQADADADGDGHPWPSPA